MEAIAGVQIEERRRRIYVKEGVSEDMETGKEGRYVREVGGDAVPHTRSRDVLPGC